jgi:large repetitive protein
VRAINGIGASEWSSGTTVTPYGTPTVPQNVRLTSSGDAPADLTASWSAPASTGGGAVDYQWRIAGAQGWQTTAGTSGRVNNVGAGTYTLEVRAINRGSNQTGPTGSDSVGVSNPPPPPPAAYICKGGPQGGGNAVVVRYVNFTSGGHRMYTSLNGDSSAFYKETFGIGGDGSQTLQNWLGVRFDSAIWVEIEGPTSISKTNSITGDRWNSLSPGQCSG